MVRACGCMLYELDPENKPSCVCGHSPEEHVDEFNEPNGACWGDTEIEVTP